MKYHPSENLIIHDKSQKTSEVTSKSIWKNFKIMKFRSDFEVVRGISGVAWLPIIFFWLESRQSDRIQHFVELFSGAASLASEVIAMLHSGGQK